MRQKVVLFFLALYSISASAQQIGNVRAEQDGNNILIFYDLIGTPSDHFYDVSVYMALDGKDFEGPLRSVSGHVGNDVTGGRNRKIVWNVLEEREELKSNSVEFKVIGRIYDAKVIEMVYIEGGEYIQGSHKEHDEKPLHSVHINDFFIGKYEITQRQWRRVMGNNPSFFDYCDECPVENVSWKDVQRFVEELNRLTNMNYRLPSEAEWEYAARGGNKSMGYVFSGSDNPDEVAWFSKNNKQHTRKPGLKKPNELGLYDMSGNVMEWCNDWYRNTYYNEAPFKNPDGPSNGTHKVIRGGSWNNPQDAIRNTNRSYSVLGGKYDDLGFRLARDVE